MLRRAFQTALLHLKPPPNPSCQMRSPRFSPEVCSMLDRMYLRKQQSSLILSAKADAVFAGMRRHCAYHPDREQTPAARNKWCLLAV